MKRKAPEALPSLVAEIDRVLAEEADVSPWLVDLIGVCRLQVERVCGTDQAAGLRGQLDPAVFRQLTLWIEVVEWLARQRDRVKEGRRVQRFPCFLRTRIWKWTA